MSRSKGVNNNFDLLLAKARRVNVRRDADDRKAGFAPPGDCDLPLQLRTVLTALEAGINTRDWNCVAEGYAMLESTEREIRK